jgi:hypothetical protein
VVLATVCGHVAGNATYVFDAAMFDRAIELLTPAEVCTAFDHPNLWSWRELRTGGEEKFVAMFVNDLTESPVDEYDAAFRARMGG